MSTLLKELSQDPRSKGSIAEKVKLYNDCNRKVAILCNHKRTVGAGHEQQMQKMGDRVSKQQHPILLAINSNNTFPDQRFALPKMAN